MLSLVGAARMPASMVAPAAPGHSSRRVLALIVVAALVGAAVGWFAHGGPDVPDEGSVDVGFLRDMADHHDQAVQLALLELANGGDPLVQGFAGDTVAAQRYEIGLMDARLRDWGVGRGAVGRTAMTWMGAGQGTPVAQMPGMASQLELNELGRLRGADADRLFVRLMTAHHEGGIHMAEDAWHRADTAAVRDLAERIAKTQRLETRDLRLVQRGLGGS
jgi:uncharacterized protein (DUF305 family)